MQGGVIVDKYVNGQYRFADERPCAYRKRAKLNAKRVNMVMLVSVMAMRADIAQKRRAFLMRNGRA